MTELTEIDQDIGDEIVYEDVIGDQYFERSSLSSTWELLLKMIVDVHGEFYQLEQQCTRVCYCRHAEDLNFLSSVYSMHHVSIDLENFLSVNVQFVVKGDKETSEFLELLKFWLRRVYIMQRSFT